jgi:hypothetical protein
MSVLLAPSSPVPVVDLGGHNAARLGITERAIATESVPVRAQVTGTRSPHYVRCVAPEICPAVAEFQLCARNVLGTGAICRDKEHLVAGIADYSVSDSSSSKSSSSSSVPQNLHTEAASRIGSAQRGHGTRSDAPRTWAIGVTEAMMSLSRTLLK